MNVYLLIVLGALLGYLLGSIPFALIIGKLFYKTDVREMGSGNLGATNVARNLGFGPGVLVALLDFAKCIFCTNLTYYVATKCATSANDVLLTLTFLITGFFCILGHCFPIFAHFKGGKAVSVICGFVIGSNWILTIIGFVIFVSVMLIKRIVSLSSIIMVTIASILSFFTFTQKGCYVFDYSIYYSVAILLMALIVIYRHKSNIIKLVNHQEKKFSFSKKK